MQTVTGVVGLVSPEDDRILHHRLGEVERDMGAVQSGNAKQAETLGEHGERLARHDERISGLEADVNALAASQRDIKADLVKRIDEFHSEYRTDRDKKAEGSRAVTVATVGGIFIVLAALVTAVASMIGHFG